MSFNFKNLLYTRPFTPRFRDVYYSSIPPLLPVDNTPKKCITCLPCVTDVYPPVGVLNTSDPGYGPGQLLGNTPQTFTATCPGGGIGDSVTVTIPADIYYSLTQEAANQLGLNAAQAQAESELSCTYGNTPQSYTATCTPPLVGTPVEVDIPENTYFASTQEAADALALAAAQAEADSEIVCAMPPSFNLAYTASSQADVDNSSPMTCPGAPNSGNPLPITSTVSQSPASFTSSGLSTYAGSFSYSREVDSGAVPAGLCTSLAAFTSGVLVIDNTASTVDIVLSVSAAAYFVQCSPPSSATTPQAVHMVTTVRNAGIGGGNYFVHRADVVIGLINDPGPKSGSDAIDITILAGSSGAIGFSVFVQSTSPNGPDRPVCTGIATLSVDLTINAA